jgi:hypothetical protein
MKKIRVENAIFDLMLARVLAGDPITRDEIAATGHGMLCLS